MARIEVKSEISGSVWKVLLRPGDRAEEEEPIMILESMKMEIPVMAPEAGTVREIAVREGDAVSEGSLVAVMEA
ncbi:biotin/lipoyl-binding carrier protein [Falsiroseomonas sp. CW058]|uniref:biotin/lipoyl-binding carrier protein n=1 Tax=Falsiroseomonas sp. CW058 TaxID=3388664 RepID=UPI003D31123F